MGLATAPLLEGVLVVAAAEAAFDVELLEEPGFLAAAGVRIGFGPGRSRPSTPAMVRLPCWS